MRSTASADARLTFFGPVGTLALMVRTSTGERATPIRVAVALAAFAIALVLAAGCQSPATPSSICNRMINTCSCFPASFNSFCIATIEGYDPTQAELDCAQGQACTTLCSESAVVAACYSGRADAGTPMPDAGLDGGARIDAPASLDAPAALDAPAPLDAPPAADAGSVADSGPSCSAATTCGACTTQAGCGWCRNRSECLPGTPAGSTGGACPAAQWSGTPAACP